MRKISESVAVLALVLVICFGVCVRAELKLLSVVFRHGDRAPHGNGIEVYPNDPYADRSFGPMGLSGLTNGGKIREFKLGQYLRKQYGDFLGSIYRPAEVSARSTNVDRTKMSLQLVLAGLYPPADIQKWSFHLDWQPIPATYVHGLDDNLMGPEECPKYLKAREKVENSKEFQAKLEPFRYFMRMLTRLTGKSVVNSNDMNFLYHALTAEKSMNLPLPEWTNDIFPHGKLLDGINLEYEIFSYNAEMKRLNGGMLLRRITDDMVKYRNGSLDQQQKLFLFSGHETNVAAVLQALGVYQPHVPEYSSAVFFELHEEDGEYYVKVKYYKGIPQVDEEMLVPGCKTDCTLDKFRSSLSEVIPSDEDIKCDKRSLRHALENNEIKVADGIITRILHSLHEEDKIRNTLQ